MVLDLEWWRLGTEPGDGWLDTIPVRCWQWPRRRGEEGPWMSGNYRCHQGWTSLRMISWSASGWFLTIIYKCALLWTLFFMQIPKNRITGWLFRYQWEFTVGSASLWGAGQSSWWAVASHRCVCDVLRLWKNTVKVHTLPCFKRTDTTKDSFLLGLLVYKNVFLTLFLSLLQERYCSVAWNTVICYLCCLQLFMGQ